MPRVLSSISLDAPASPVSENVDGTFAFSGTPSFGGSGGVQRYDFKWEVNSGAGYVTIGASGTGLITAGTNPLVNTNSSSQNSITVTCESGGSYTIRMVGAPTSGGSYTVASSTQTVEVSAAADALTADSLSSGAPTLSSPVVGQIHGLAGDGVASGTPTLSSPVLSEASGTDDLSATGLSTGSPSLGTPVVGQQHVLAGSSLASSSPSTGSPVIGQTHVLTASGITGTVTLGSPLIGQIHAMSGEALTTGAPTLGSPTIGAAGVDALEPMGLLIAGMFLGAPSLSVPSSAKSPAFIPRAKRSWRQRNDEYEKMLRSRRR